MVVVVSTQVYTPAQTSAAATAVSAALAAAVAPAAGAAELEVVEIASSVTFPVAIDAISEGSPERVEFEAGFIISMAASLGGTNFQYLSTHSS